MVDTNNTDIIYSHRLMVRERNGCCEYLLLVPSLPVNRREKVWVEPCDGCAALVFETRTGRCAVVIETLSDDFLRRADKLVVMELPIPDQPDGMMDAQAADRGAMFPVAIHNTATESA